MIKILLLSCGTNSAYHFSSVIKQKYNNEISIIGADCNEKFLVSSSCNIDKFYKSPLSISPEYYDFVLTICKKEKINYILPILDTDLILFNTDNSNLKSLNIQSLSINEKAIPLYQNKRLMNETLAKYKLPIPQSYFLNELQHGTSYIIKPIAGYGSKGVEKLTKSEIEKKENIQEYLIQEECTGPEVTVECFYYANKISTVARERIETKAGVCTKTKIYKDVILDTIIQKFVSSFPVPLFFNLQFMKNSNKEYVITDVNLRLAGGMSLSYAAGWDEVSAIANFMLNKSKEEIFIPISNQIPEQYVVRVYRDIVTKINKPVIAFDLDGTLLDSRKRHQIVLDYVLKEKGISSLNTDYLLEFKRKGKSNLDFLLENNISKELALAIQNEWVNCIENEEFLQADSLYPNTVKWLNDLSSQNDLILITARNNKYLCMKQLIEFDLVKYFKNIYIIKSDKLSYVKKAEFLIKENAIKFIGDTEVDKNAAQLADIPFELVTHGFRSEEFLLTC